jgi:hypothetical protein
MDRIQGELAQLRIQSESYIDAIDAEQSARRQRGITGPSDPHARLVRTFHERLLRLEEVVPAKRNITVANQAPATASEVDLWEAHPDVIQNYPTAVRALIARIRQYEVDLVEARDWAILNRKRADDAVAGKKVEPLDAP